MKKRAAATVLVLAFSVSVGHLAWHSFLGPAPTPEYFVDAQGRALCSPDHSAKNLYLRRQLRLSQPPRHSWLQVVGRDRLRVFVNGKLIKGEDREGFPVAVITDLAPYLQVGTNVIAIAARQASFNGSPVVAVRGAYTLSDGESQTIEPDQEWRCSTRFERGNQWWFSPCFQDRHWTVPQVVTVSIRSPLETPPEAVMTPNLGQWITPVSSNGLYAAIHREFFVEGRPQQAWLRLTATAGYRLAVNGILVDQREDQLGTGQPVVPVRYMYDVTTVMRRGRNVVAVLLARSEGTPPHLLADLEVVDQDGNRVQIGTGAEWLSRSGSASGWLDAGPGNAGKSEEWQPSHVESGDLGVPAWWLQSQDVALRLPVPVVLQRLAGQAVLILLIAAVTWLACRMCARRLSRRLGVKPPAAVSYLALAPAALGIAAAKLASYDPRIPQQAVYQMRWVGLAVLSVPLQWYVLALMPTGVGVRVRNTLKVSGNVLLVVALMAVGFWLRLDRLATEPIQWDEVENYEYTIGFLERGFPSRQVHPDLPVAYAHTSELMFVPTALAALIFEDARYVVRFPAVCWSVLTILLIYVAGRRMFSPSVGLIAAVFLTFSPVCIAMSNFGRYFSQLQFFCLLAIFALWLTVRGHGPLDTRALWITAFSFIAMYLTWEGSAFLAIGMCVAALVHRRGRLRTILGNSSVWLSLFVVLLALLLQYSHVVLQQTQFLWYGTSLSDLRIRPMWSYPTFQPWFYVWETSWTLDALIPMLGLAGAIFLAACHVFRHAIRFLLLIHLITCFFMASLLPAIAWRYIHHLIPLSIMFTSATIVASAGYLTRLARQPGAGGWVSDYARGMAGLLVGIVVLVGSGTVLDLREMPRLRVEGYDLWRFKFPDLKGPSLYVRNHLKQGDVVLATDPYQVKHFMDLSGKEKEPLFFWPESILQLSATLDNKRALPLDRRDGTPILADVESYRDLFARHDRIWYVIQPDRHENQNVPEVSAFLRQHMDVVYEDFEAMVLLRDRNHQPANLRREDERRLELAGTDFLPGSRPSNRESVLQQLDRYPNCEVGRGGEWNQSGVQGVPGLLDYRGGVRGGERWTVPPVFGARRAVGR